MSGTGWNNLSERKLREMCDEYLIELSENASRATMVKKLEAYQRNVEALAAQQVAEEAEEARAAEEVRQAAEARRAEQMKEVEQQKEKDEKETV